jgi:hypothetical protein
MNKKLSIFKKKNCYNETRKKIKKKQKKRKVESQKRKKRSRMHHHNNIGVKKHAHGTFCCNLGLGLMTKAKACKSASQE